MATLFVKIELVSLNQFSGVKYLIVAFEQIRVNECQCLKQLLILIWLELLESSSNIGYESLQLLVACAFVKHFNLDFTIFFVENIHFFD